MSRFVAIQFQVLYNLNWNICHQMKLCLTQFKTQYPFVMDMGCQTKTQLKFQKEIISYFKMWILYNLYITKILGHFVSQILAVRRMQRLASHSCHMMHRNRQNMQFYSISLHEWTPTGWTHNSGYRSGILYLKSYDTVAVTGEECLHLIYPLTPYNYISLFLDFNISSYIITSYPWFPLDNVHGENYQ